MLAVLLREEARLRSIFQRLVLASLAAAPLGCSSGEDAAETKDGSAAGDSAGGSGGGDATLTQGDDAAGAADASAPHDAACDPVYADGEAGCDFYETLACNLPPGTATEGCAIYLVGCTQICGETVGYPCTVVECAESGVIPTSGPITVECTTGKVGCADGGRRPAGLVEEGGGSETSLGAWLARLAWMEAASVHAFRALASELASRGAPGSLVAAAMAATKDEMRHARLVGRLARRHGHLPRRARVARRQERSLAAFARENAIEGCVRETFSALVATWQSSRAADPELASAMKAIARDEARHAALAWATSAWLDPQLDPEVRASVRASMRGALRALRCEVATLPAELARAAGLPYGADGAALVDALGSALLA